MLKIAGSIVTIMAATLLGAYAASELETAYQEMLYLYRLIRRLQGEIRYSRSVLSQIFLKISRDARPPYDAWLRQMSVRMESRKGGDFASIWRESVASYLSVSKLSRKEKERLGELGMALGDVDMEMQINHLNSYLDQLLLSIQDLRGEIQNKKRLCRCMGIAGGIFIAILLV